MASFRHRPHVKRHAPGRQAGRDQPRILCLDDEEGLLNLEVKILREQGYHVDCTSHPEQAWKMLQDLHKPYDLIISDCDMPEAIGGRFGNGIGFAKAVCGNIPSPPPILLCTANSMEALENTHMFRELSHPLMQQKRPVFHRRNEQFADSLPRGIVAVVNKPYEVANFLETVRQALDVEAGIGRG